MLCMLTFKYKNVHGEHKAAHFALYMYSFIFFLIGKENLFKNYQKDKALYLQLQIQMFSNNAQKRTCLRRCLPVLHPDSLLLQHHQVCYKHCNSKKTTPNKPYPLPQKKPKIASSSCVLDNSVVMDHG